MSTPRMSTLALVALLAAGFAPTQSISGWGPTSAGATAITSLPYTISIPGKYRVTKNLAGSSGNDGITITVSDVHLDLGGWILRGVSGSGHGIHVTGSGIVDINVFNGTLRNWDGNGIQMTNTEQSTVADVRLIANGGDGVRTGDGCRILRCTAEQNGEDGLDPSSDAVVVDCISRYNTKDGIEAGQGSTVSRCTAAQNSGAGFDLVGEATASDCTAQSNALEGFDVGDNCVLRGCSASHNTGNGIDTQTDCLVVDSQSLRNGGAGILVRTDSQVERCVSIENDSNGIETEANCHVAGCTVNKNGASGILLSDRCTASGSTVNDNVDYGIEMPGSSSAEDCAIVGNVLTANGTSASSTADRAGIHAGSPRIRIEGNHATGNSGAGILVDTSATDCTVRGNSCASNGTGSITWAGIRVQSTGCTIDDNHVAGNSGPGIQVTGTGNVIVRNVATNGDVHVGVGGNDWGPTGTAAAATSPMANIQ